MAAMSLSLDLTRYPGLLAYALLHGRHRRYLLRTRYSSELHGHYLP